MGRRAGSIGSLAMFKVIDAEHPRYAKRFTDLEKAHQYSAWLTLLGFRPRIRFDVEGI